MSFRESLTGIVLWTIVRLWVGWEWLTSGWVKVFGTGREVWVGSKAGVALTSLFNGALAKSEGANPDVQAWYAWFVHNIALPGSKVFSYIIAYGEIIIGIALILGLLTVPALLIGVIINLNYLLAGIGGINPILLTLEAILLFVGPAVYYIGLDRWVIPDISRRWGRNKRMGPIRT